MQHTVVLNECDMGTFGHVWVDSTEGSLAIVHKEELMVGVTRSAAYCSSIATGDQLI